MIILSYVSQIHIDIIIATENNFGLEITLKFDIWILKFKITFSLRKIVKELRQFKKDPKFSRNTNQKFRRMPTVAAFSDDYMMILISRANTVRVTKKVTPKQKMPCYALKPKANLVNSTKSPTIWLEIQQNILAETCLFLQGCLESIPGLYSCWWWWSFNGNHCQTLKSRNDLYGSKLKQIKCVIVVVQFN